MIFSLRTALALAVFMLCLTGSASAAPIDTFITSGPQGVTGHVNPQFTFESNVGAATFRCKIDQADWSTCPTPFTAPAQSQGTHTLFVAAYDLGLQDSTPATRTFHVDSLAPIVSFTGGLPNHAITNDTMPAFTFNVLDATNVDTECRVTGGLYELCSSGWSPGPLAEGEWEVEVRGVDGAGNVSTPITRDFTVDLTAPVTKIIGPDSTADTTPTFRYTAGDSPGQRVFQCKVDAAGSFPCDLPPGELSGQLTVGPLAPGQHTLLIRATDAAGNVEVAPATKTFTVTAPPATTPAPAATAPSPPAVAPGLTPPAPARAALPSVATKKPAVRKARRCRTVVKKAKGKKAKRVRTCAKKATKKRSRTSAKRRG